MIRLLIIAALLISSKVYEEKNTDALQWISFDWESAEVEGSIVEKAFMNIPFKIDGLENSFNAQLDLGAPRSMLYENSILPYIERFPFVFNNLDTTEKFCQINGVDCGGFYNLDLNQGNYKFNLDRIAFYPDFGQKPKSLEVGKQDHVGSFGADLFEDKILIIDYPNQKLLITDTLPKVFKQVEFLNAKLDRNDRFLLPLDIDGTTYSVLYDTGSSMFSLISKKSICESNCDLSTIDSLIITSWGNNRMLYSAELANLLKIGKAKFNRTLCYWFANLEDYWEEESGIVGNKLFLKKQVVLDFKNKRFGIK